MALPADRDARRARARRSLDGLSVGDSFGERFFGPFSAGMGDRDTTCAIAGGIVALSAPTIPPSWLAAREPLPRSIAP